MAAALSVAQGRRLSCNTRCHDRQEGTRERLQKVVYTTVCDNFVLDHVQVFVVWGQVADEHYYVSHALNRFLVM